MEYIKTLGLTIRCVKFKESSKMLTVLTPEHGKLDVSAHGTQSRRNMIRAASEPFTLSDMTISSKNESHSLSEAIIIEQFQELTYSLEAYSLASYIAELAGTLSDQYAGTGEILAIILTAFRKLCADSPNFTIIKAAAELRLMAASGFYPNVNPTFLGPTRLDAGARLAVKHVLTSELRRVFSFSLENPLLFADACEMYVLTNLERTFKTLEYFKSIVP